ncbi:helix-turn-helix domain-containing protein [Streptomyces crystallinus]|uniref:PucR C-terminal helix-turn-helix domain-containing protein n=1 Tax=Streptomyces crystallinus TaxID=68191 RepID=A0ABN1GRX2_9ACTN
MTTLGALAVDRDDLELRLVWPQWSAAHLDTEIAELATVPMERLTRQGGPGALPSGALVLLTGATSSKLRGRTACAMESLLRGMAQDGCRALAVQTTSPAPQPFPQTLRDVADETGIALLVTTASAQRWQHARSHLQQCRLAASEESAARLNALVAQLPSRLADPRAMQRMVDWLAQTLDAQVLVSRPPRALAASSDTAVQHLSWAVIRQSIGGQGVPAPGDLHVQLVPLAPTVAGNAVLAVGRPTALGESDMRLVRHTAKAVGLVDQAGHEFRARNDAARAALAAAVELLLAAEVDKARRVLAALVPGLLDSDDSDAARIYVVETARGHRQDAVDQCESVVDRRALVAADPYSESRLLVVQPVRPGPAPDDRLVRELTRLVGALGPNTRMGGSGAYPLGKLGDALREALTALRCARHRPDSVALSVQHADLVSLLPQNEAHAWALHLLRPLLHDRAHWPTLRDTLPTALAHPCTVAARRLALHRNTLARRVTKAGELLSADLSQVSNKVAVTLALEIATQRGALPDPPAAVGDAAPAPSLERLLCAPEVRAWGRTLLGAARADRRRLITTATAWLACNLHVEPAARALGVSHVTVRSHLRTLEGHLARDLTSLSGVRDLSFSLHVVTGRPLGTVVGEEAQAGV